MFEKVRFDGDGRNVVISLPLGVSQVTMPADEFWDMVLELRALDGSVSEQFSFEFKVRG